MAGALDGIRVVELANYVSGPYAGMMLADFGAEVIKVEVPGTGDPFRGWGTVDYSPTFGSVNRSKKSVALDLKSELAGRGGEADRDRRHRDRELPSRHARASWPRLRQLRAGIHA